MAKISDIKELLEMGLTAEQAIAALQYITPDTPEPAQQTEQTIDNDIGDRLGRIEDAIKANNFYTTTTQTKQERTLDDVATNFFKH